ncbi:MAG: aldehyde dehydrogenase family protein [Acidimicrobiales bacterium]
MDMFVAGEWRSGPSQEPLYNPFNGEVIGTVPLASATELEQAIAGAVKGAEKQRATDAYTRQAVLSRAGDIADSCVDELATTIALETGKTLVEARSEATRAGDLLRLSAFEGSQLYGHSLPLDAQRGAGQSRLGFTLREPCGVVAAITPFNYPLLLVVHKVGPALAAGNSVVLKPARSTPLVALKLVEILLQAGLAREAISCITGDGQELGSRMCADPRIRKVSFTGSTATGQAITRVAGIKRLSLELGASCPVAVLRDADIELAASAVAVGGYVNAGQVCISVQRVLVDRAVTADFLDALTAKVGEIRTGDPFAPSTTMGSLIDEASARRIEAVLRDGAGDSARVLCGGEREGAVLSPAVVADVDPRSPLSQEELFGPAVAVTSVSDMDEAVALANGTPFGLGAGIFTRDVSNAVRFAREAVAGTIHVNWTPLWRADLMPYGGIKGSGVGKEGPRWAVEEMTEAKTVILHGTT